MYSDIDMYYGGDRNEIGSDSSAEQDVGAAVMLVYDSALRIDDSCCK